MRLGGLAYGSVDNEAVSAGYVNNPNTVVTGYVLGGGIEYKIKHDLSVKVEYQYANLGKNERQATQRPAARFATMHSALSASALTSSHLRY